MSSSFYDNLIFLRGDFEEFNSHSIISNLRGSSDHVPLVVSITIQEKFIQEKKLSLYKESDKEKKFIDQIWVKFGNFNTSNIEDIQGLEDLAELSWNTYMKWANITKCSKEWWNNECTAKLETYCNLRFLLNWKDFRKMVKKTKQSFFDKNIREVTLKNKKLWVLIIGSRNINSWHQKLWSSIVDYVSN